MTFQIIRSWRACKDESDTQRILYKSIIRSCSITRILQFFEYWESCFLSPSGDLKNKPRIGTIRDVSFFFFYSKSDIRYLPAWVWHEELYSAAVVVVLV